MLVFPTNDSATASSNGYDTGSSIALVLMKAIRSRIVIEVDVTTVRCGNTGSTHHGASGSGSGAGAGLCTASSTTGVAWFTSAGCPVAHPTKTARAMQSCDIGLS